MEHNQATIPSSSTEKEQAAGEAENEERAVFQKFQKRGSKASAGAKSNGSNTMNNYMKLSPRTGSKKASVDGTPGSYRKLLNLKESPR